MRLYVMRHGVAIDATDPQSPPDPERYLTPKGIAKTREAAQGLAQMGVAPGVWLTSPYRRAVQTAEVVAGVLKFPAEKIRQTAALKPSAPPAAFFEELARLRAREVIVFGHAPNVDLVVALALGSREALTSLKKAGVALVELDAPAPGRGSLVWLLPPKALRLLGE